MYTAGSRITITMLAQWDESLNTLVPPTGGRCMLPALAELGYDSSFSIIGTVGVKKKDYGNFNPLSRAIFTRI
jgi:hypothetical protein